MFRVAARLSRAVTPSSPAHPLCAGPSTQYHSPRMRVQRAEGSLARVWGEEPQPFPYPYRDGQAALHHTRRMAGRA